MATALKVILLVALPLLWGLAGDFLFDRLRRRVQGAGGRADESDDA